MPTAQLEQLIQVCDECSQGENYNIINGICISTHRCEDFNAFIFDYGVLTDKNTQSFFAGDFCFLVTGTKPWEVPALFRKLLLCKNRNIRFLLSFSTSKDVEKLTEYLGEQYSVAPYCPDIWESVDSNYLDNMLYDDIKEYCGGL